MPQKRKDWRKISTADVEEALDTAHVNRDLAAKDLANELFEIDIEGASKTTKRERRGQVSFAKKHHALLESEEKKLEKYTKKLKVRKEQQAKPDKSLDIWGEKEAPKLWCGQTSKESRIRVSGKMEPYHRPKTLDHRPSVAPAVAMAHSGQSINPKQENYDALVSEAAAIELKKEEQEDYFFRSSQGMTADLIDRYGKEAVREMSQEEKVKLFLGEAPVNETPVELPVKKVTERKTTAQRNKEARVKAMKAAHAKAKLSEKFHKSLGDLGTVIKDIKKTTKAEADAKALKQKKKAHQLEMEKKGRLVGKAKIGKYVFQEPALEAAQPRNDEEGVKTSVRRAQVLMGSAIRDRMHSILRRKLLPANPIATSEMLTKAKEARFHKRKLRKYCNAVLREAVRDGKVKKQS